MRIKSSSDVSEFRSGQSVSLQCWSVCSFYHLEITWMRDGHALSETGPTLHIRSLTTKDSGNYTCALKTNIRTESAQTRLLVEEGWFRFYSVTFSENFIFLLRFQRHADSAPQR